jgi:hypothetical protein
MSIPMSKNEEKDPVLVDNALSDTEIEELKSRIQALERELFLLERKYYKNRFYQMFYGEWEATGNIVADPIPVRGVLYDDNEHQEWLEFLSEEIKGNSIQFTQDSIVINDEKTINNIKYNYTIFPATDDYWLHFTLTLEDIGITELAGNYYILVEADSKEDRHFHGSRFFIKDRNTLIITPDNIEYFEYTRVSYEGGSEEVVIFVG